LHVTTREQLHAIVDELSDDLLPSAAESLELLRREKARAFWEAMENAPEDDEELTDEELAQLDAAIARLDAGLRISDAEAHRILGF
jgi:hypothetical protein